MIYYWLKIIDTAKTKSLGVHKSLDLTGYFFLSCSDESELNKNKNYNHRRMLTMGILPPADVETLETMPVYVYLRRHYPPPYCPETPPCPSF